MTEWLIRDSRQPEMVLHATTESVLIALKSLRDEGQPPGLYNILEIGCGSGLVSIVAANLCADSGILACDISPQAVDDAAYNVQQHGLAERITVIRADGYDHAAIREQAPYDLVICNLLAENIIKDSPHVW